MRRPKRRWLMGAAAVSAAVVMMPGIVRAAWPQPEGWPTILSQSAGPEVAVARGVKEQDAVLTTDAGPLVIHRLDVDLTAPQLTVRAVAAGDKVFAGRGETVSSMANRTGAVAGINGDFYDIGQTYGPLNILVADGQLYRSPIGWAALAIDGQNRASIVKFQWNGRMMVLPGGENLDAWTKSGQKAAPPQGQGQPLAAFNSFLGDDGIFLYDDKFGYSFPAPSPGAHRVAVYLSKTADPAIYTVDSVVENRAVSPVSPGKAVLIGHGQWADWLAGNLAAGEKIEVMLNTAPDWRNYRTVVGGGPILLKDGQVYDDPNKPLPGETGVRNPIMAVGLSADGRSMVMVAVDGRQPGRSIGLTQREMAAYLLALGYRDAMAFDSGGSVDMVVRRPGQEGVAVVNSPSDGFERAVADGLFVYSSLPPEPPSPPGGTQPGEIPSRRPAPARNRAAEPGPEAARSRVGAHSPGPAHSQRPAHSPVRTRGLPPVPNPEAARR
ncbi:MAG: phosphodiester glycosidase family protein [Kyrpidia sp.]|nr:phosphodiester glycosidase family protein [Kyrpidia sp.]